MPIPPQCKRVNAVALSAFFTTLLLLFTKLESILGSKEFETSSNCLSHVVAVKCSADDDTMKVEEILRLLTINLRSPRSCPHITSVSKVLSEYLYFHLERIRRSKEASFSSFSEVELYYKLLILSRNFSVNILSDTLLLRT